MKTIERLLGLSILIVLLGSCSAVKITDSWKDVSTNDIKDKSIMVVSRTSDEVVRTRFEKDLVSNLNEKGYQSIESYTLFPGSDSNCDVDEEELQQVKKELQDHGVEVIVVTHLRDTEEYTETITTGTSYSIHTFPYYRRGYYRGYYRYYGPTYVVSDPITQVTTHRKKYILETLIYDLTKPEEKQLIGVITSSIEDPETLSGISKDYAKQIVKKINT